MVATALAAVVVTRSLANGGVSSVPHTPRSGVRDRMRRACDAHVLVLEQVGVVFLCVDLTAGIVPEVAMVTR